MNEPLTREWLDKLGALVEQRAAIFHRNAPGNSAVVCAELADAVPKLLDALRWRRAGDELPEVGVELAVEQSDTKHHYCARYEKKEHHQWAAPNGSFDALQNDLWLPLPPK